MAKYDVSVVGAGPAGASAAKETASSGLETIIIDRRNKAGLPVQCGELIPTPAEAQRLFPRSKRMPKVVSVPRQYITNRTRAIRLISPNGSFYEFPFEANIVDRSRYDQYLVDSAKDVGAEILLSSTVIDRSSTNGLTIRSKNSRQTVNAKVVIGADGSKSTIARTLGPQFIQPESDLSPALQYVMSDIDIDTDVVEMHFSNSIAPGGYAWVIPKGDNIANIGFGMRRSIGDDTTPLRKYIERFVFKTLSQKVKRAKILRRVGAIIPIGGPLGTTWSDNVLLVGDAAGHVMASNGGGVPTALCGGQIAGEAVVKSLTDKASLVIYEQKWKAEFGLELETALQVLRIADTVMPSDSLTDICMSLAGVRFLEPLIRCQLPLPISLASKTVVKLLNQIL